MDRDGCRRAWLDLAPRKHRDRHGPMGPAWKRSKRSGVAAAGMMVVQRKRWIGTGATWGVRVTEHTRRIGFR